ncbi:MAG: hypothetical protein R3B54_08695 [Bdellovibrionota bacterium]
MGAGQQPTLPFVPTVTDNGAAQQAADALAAQVAAESERQNRENRENVDDIARAIQDLFDDVNDDQNDDNEVAAIPGQNGKAGKAAAAPAASAPPVAPPIAATPTAQPQGGNEQPPFDPNQQIPPFQPPQFPQQAFGNNDNNSDDGLTSLTGQQYTATPFNAPTENFSMLQQQQNQLMQQNAMLAQGEFQRRLMMGPAGAQGMSPYGPYAAGYQFPGQQQQAGMGSFAANIQNFGATGGLQQQRVQVPTTPQFRLGNGDTSVLASAYGGRTNNVPTAVAARGGNAARSVR